MLKSRIILVVVTLVLVTFLFTLPKVVVDNKSEEIESNSGTPKTSDHSEGSITEMHKIELPSGTKEKVANWRTQIADAGFSENYTNFADSLARAYAGAMNFDSAVYYAEAIMVKNSALKWKLMAADIYYDGYQFTLDEEKMARYGKKARELYTQILVEDPDNMKAKINMAMTYVSSSNPMQGIAMLREVLEKDPSNRDALFNMGMLSIQSGQYDRAIVRFERITDLYPGDLQARFYLGVSYFETNKKQQAKKQFEEILKLDQDPAVVAAVEEYLKRIN